MTTKWHGDQKNMFQKRKYFYCFFLLSVFVFIFVFFIRLTIINHDYPRFILGTHSFATFAQTKQYLFDSINNSPMSFFDGVNLVLLYTSGLLDKISTLKSVFVYFPFFFTVMLVVPLIFVQFLFLSFKKSVNVHANNEYFNDDVTTVYSYEEKLQCKIRALRNNIIIYILISTLIIIALLVINHYFDLFRYRELYSQKAHISKMFKSGSISSELAFKQLSEIGQICWDTFKVEYKFSLLYSSMITLALLFPIVKVIKVLFCLRSWNKEHL